MAVEMWDSIKEKYYGIFDEQYEFITELYEDSYLEVEMYLKRRED